MDDPKLLGEQKESGVLYTATGKRMMILPVEFYKAVFEALKDVMGNAAKTMIYYIGVKAGKEMAQDAKSFREGSGNVADVKAIAGVLQEMGIGHIEKVEQEDSKIVLVIGNSISSELKLSKDERCHLERGLVAGMLSALTGKRVVVKTLDINEHRCAFEVEITG